MNKTAIKNFAIWARNKLISDVSYRAGLMGITADGIADALPQSTVSAQFYDIGIAEPYMITGEQIIQRNHLVQLIKEKEAETNYKTAYKYVLEEIAYTWFNRLIAIRFMEVNDYLPSHIRVLSSENGKLEPDIVTTPFDADLDFSDKEREAILQLKNDNKLDEVFRILFVKQCNALNDLLPALFEETADYSEALLNISAIDKDGVVYRLVNDIPEEDFNINEGGQVEIIGWLYQYYNTEPKNEAFAKDGKITKEEIPAVTQLFTPDWIVRYMVENSLGRLWVEGHPNDQLKSNWKYYLEEAEQELDVQTKLDEIHEEYYKLNPTDIKVIDPCMGSGHILVYAFDVLIQIYASAGYSERDAARSILENNIYGLDIDDRAYQMAYFAVMMKARQYNRRILSKDTPCHVYSIQESNNVNRVHLNYMGSGLTELEKNEAKQQLNELLDTFIDAKEYGSILNVKEYSWDLLREFIQNIDASGQISLESVGIGDTQKGLLQLVAIGEVMAREYEIVITNPPYMGMSNADRKLNAYVQDFYPDGKADLYAVFIEKCTKLAIESGLVSMITQQTWMFLTSFLKLREKLQNKELVNMIHLGARAFDEIGGEVVKTTTFILRNTCLKSKRSRFVRVVESIGEENKRDAYIRAVSNSDDLFVASSDWFSNIYGSPLAYWATFNEVQLFKNSKSLDEKFDARSGLQTNDNNKFLRVWFEVNIFKTSIANGGKWYPHLKGGSFRRWYGNEEYVVNWEHDGKEILAFASKLYGSPTRTAKSIDKYFLPGFTWSDVSTGLISVRKTFPGYIFDTTAPTITAKNAGTDCPQELLGYMNSKVAQALIACLAPDTHYNCGSISQLPYIEITNDHIKKLVCDCVSLSKEDWDSFENSWGYKKNPFIGGEIMGRLISDKYKEWEAECNERFNQLKANEEELNRLFIDIYGLQDELTPEVEDKDVTVRKADLQRDIKSLISYAVGCMFGRYSLDVEGLAYAGGEWDDSKYSTFIPDQENIIPITDEEYFKDDIVGYFCSWLKKVYGEDTLEQNLDFIASALGNKGNTSREIIRNYFLNDFFKDHCQTYSVTGSGKRPIYWLFDSGKQNGFKALIYLHRYNADIIGDLRVDYLHRMQRVYETEITHMQSVCDDPNTNSREKGAAEKKKEKLQKQLKECRDYDEKIGHLALSRIELDLDDGVKVNYRKLQTANDGKFYEVLADSKSIMVKDKK